MLILLIFRRDARIYVLALRYKSSKTCVNHFK